jgi:hypothetical protein
MKRSVILAFAGLLAVQPALAGHTVPPNRPGAYAPRDTCVKTPAARIFKARLHSAITRRDARALAELAANDVQLDFGGGGGKALLRSQLTGAEGPALWRELEEAVSLGCAMDAGGMVFPWLFAQNLGDVDPFEALVTTGPAVPLYARANIRSAPIARLNWQMVTIQEGDLGPDADKHLMRRVSVINSSLEGYVPSDKLRSVIAHRLIVRRQGGRWEIISFVAGD